MTLRVFVAYYLSAQYTSLYLVSLSSVVLGEYSIPSGNVMKAYSVEQHVFFRT